MHKNVPGAPQGCGTGVEIAATPSSDSNRRSATDARKRTVVCLLVDEIQTVTEASAPAVQLLHTRSFSPPVLPIYAGLDDSVDKLENGMRDLAPVRRGPNADGPAARERVKGGSQEAVREVPRQSRRRRTRRVDRRDRRRGARLRPAPARQPEGRLERAHGTRGGRTGRGRPGGTPPRTRGERTVLQLEDRGHRRVPRGGDARRGPQSNASKHTGEQKRPDRVGKGAHAQA